MDKYLPDEEIDALCDQFEQQLVRGESPAIADYLPLVEQKKRSRLLYWLLTVQASKSSNTEEERQRCFDAARREYPQHSEVIDAVAGIRKADREFPEISGYRFVDTVGQGGQGEVHRAIQERTGQPVAIKLVSAKKLDSIPHEHRAAVVDRLQQEIRTTASLNHPNIVKVYDAGECADGFYFVMQWVPGGSLIARSDSMSQVEVARIVRATAAALDAAHASGVLHLDVKPHNILFDNVTGQPLLADFGLARLLQESSTSNNSIAGTIGYMAPEQAAGRQLDRRTDVYGLGATLYFLLTGTRAYEDVSLPYQETQRQAWLPVPPKQRNPSINGELESICMRCLAIDAAERYSNCHEVAAALDRFALTEDGHRIARMSERSLATSPLFLIINLLVMVQLQLGWAQTALEPLIWITMFSMYVVVFFILGSVNKLDRHSPAHLAIESLWAVWGAKALAALAIAASLRLLTTGPSTSEPAISGGTETVILMCYPMFSALTGFALATIAPRYWRPLYGFAAVAWLNSLLLMWLNVQGSMLAPAVYGAAASMMALLWGLKLRKFSREQTGRVPSNHAAMTLDWQQIDS